MSCFVYVAAAVIGACFGMVRHANSYEREREAKVRELEEEKRCDEIFQASIKKQEIADRAVADKHVDLVSALSSRDWTMYSSGGSDRERASYQYGNKYLRDSTNIFLSSYPHVFRYTENLPRPYDCFPPSWWKKSSTAFIFAGIVSSLRDDKARKQILKGEYIRCGLTRFENMCDDQIFEPSEVIITGTTDCQKCVEFQEHLKKGY